MEPFANWLKRWQNQTTRLSRQLQRLIQDWEKIDTRPNDLEKQIRRCIELTEETRTVFTEPYDQILQFLQQSRNSMAERSQRWKIAWFREFQDKLSKHGLSVRGEGERWEFPPIHLEPDWNSQRVRVMYGPDELERLPADTLKIVAWLKKWKEISNKPLFTTREFVDRMWKVYRKILPTSGPSRVPLTDIYREIVLEIQPKKFWVDAKSQNLVAYPRYRFSMDLATLRDNPEAWSQDYHIHMVTATFDNTRHREDYIWIPDPGSSRGSRFSWLTMERIIKLT